jgi:hypothetical protein
VPAGRSGNLDLIDPDTKQVTALVDSPAAHRSMAGTVMALPLRTRPWSSLRDGSGRKAARCHRSENTVGNRFGSDRFRSGLRPLRIYNRRGLGH